MSFVKLHTNGKRPVRKSACGSGRFYDRPHPHSIAKLPDLGKTRESGRATVNPVFLNSAQRSEGTRTRQPGGLTIFD